MWDAVDLAKYIVTKCTRDNCPISNLQLQKILYYVQKDALHRTGQPLFYNAIEAWKFGPVVPAVYYRFGCFGAMPIDMIYSTIKEPEEDIKGNIDRIVEEKRKLSPWVLVNDTHKEGGAWDRIFDGGNGNREEIPRDLIAKEA